MVRVFSEILISLTMIVVLVNLEDATGAETSESREPTSESQEPTSEPQEPTSEPQEQVEDLSNVMMLPKVVRRIIKFQDGRDLFDDDDYYGRHFTATDGLYNHALTELPSWMNEYVGEDLKYEKIAPHFIAYGPNEHRNVNLVLCRATGRNFWLWKLNDKNYIIYRETLDS